MKDGSQTLTSSLIPDLRHSRCDYHVGRSHEQDAFGLFLAYLFADAEAALTQNSPRGVFRQARLPTLPRLPRLPFSHRGGIEPYSQQTKPLLVRYQSMQKVIRTWTHVSTKTALH